MNEPQLLELISVHPNGGALHRGRLAAGSVVVPCALGRSGVTSAKHEGDGASPAGTWPLRRVMFRPDRVELPATHLPVSAIAPGDGWCDDPADPRYNCPVRLPHGTSAETLWRDDEVYDIIVVLGYNDDPPRPGLGSAIFFHLATADFAPTAGCIAVHRPDMVRLLAYCGPDTKLEIGKAPHAVQEP